MILNAKNGVVRIENDAMHYIRFGSGERTLIMLPGLGDGLTTVKGKALPTALLYRSFSKEFTVYMFSRRSALPEGCSTRDMARDLKKALDALGIAKADLLGVSMGGMIAQHFAADYPQAVGRLILVVTCPESNPLLAESIAEWVSCAQRGDTTAFMDSNIRRMYSEAYYHRNKWLTPLIGRITKPRSYERFYIQANACLTHNASDRLSAISAPTLVIGGEQDRALGGEPSHAIAAAIPGAALKMYPEWGHGLYEEAKDFHQVVQAFLLS